MKRCIVAALLIWAAGCSSSTETGYEPRKLSDSATVQRGYYARPFSPEAEAARFNQGPDRRPELRP